MTSDLFGERTVEEPWKNRGNRVPRFHGSNPTNVGRPVEATVPPFPPDEPVEKRGMKSPGVSPKSRAGTRGTDRVVRIAELRCQIVDLQRDLGECDERIFRLQRDYDRLKGAFEAAHQNAVEIVGRTRGLHRHSMRKMRLGAYDARMLAGHAWHPIRKVYRELETWRREITKELRLINAEMER